MKKKLAFLLLCTLFLSGCANPAQTQSVQIANPWKSFDSLGDAQKETGFCLDIDENLTVSGYTANSFRVLNGSLLEVRFYAQDLSKVTVRKSLDIKTDLSGVYQNWTQEFSDPSGKIFYKGDAQNIFVVLVFKPDCSFSFYFEDGLSPEDAQELIGQIF